MAICLNFGIADEYGGRTHLRFDDTNPLKEDPEYARAIQDDVRWLGFEWDELYYAADYFDQLYDHAEALILKGKAFVDSESEEEIGKDGGASRSRAVTVATATEPSKRIWICSGGCGRRVR